MQPLKNKKIDLKEQEAEIKSLIEQHRSYEAYLQKVADKAKEMTNYINYVAEDFEDKEKAVLTIHRVYEMFALKYFDTSSAARPIYPVWKNSIDDRDDLSFNYYEADIHRFSTYYDDDAQKRNHIKLKLQLPTYKIEFLETNGPVI